MRVLISDDITGAVEIKDFIKNPVRIGRASSNDLVLKPGFIAPEAGRIYNDADGKGWKYIPTSDGWSLDDVRLPRNVSVVIESGQTLSHVTCHLTVTWNPENEETSDVESRRILDQKCAEIINNLHGELLSLLKERGDTAKGDPDNSTAEYVLDLEQSIGSLAERHPEFPASNLVRTHAGDYFAGLFLKFRLLRLVTGGETSGQALSEPDRSEIAGFGGHWSQNQSYDRNAEGGVRAQIATIAERLAVDVNKDMSEQINNIERGFWQIWNEMIEGLSAATIRYMYLSQVRKEVKDIMFGMGPLQDLLDNPTISEIMVNDADHIFIEKNGIIENSGRRFVKDLEDFIRRVVSRVQRKIDSSDPMVDARLADGSRINAIIKPLTVGGPCLTIRRFPKKPLTMERLIEIGAVTPAARDFLAAAVQIGCNILVAGGTGTGKTTLLNALSHFIPDKERIITIEDTAELKLQKSHVVRLETKQNNVEGKGAVEIRELVKNALRMRPDRIIVGECRGGEALDMLQAMNTGHDGSMTTLHANTPKDVVSRLEVLVQYSKNNLPVSSIHQQIASAIDLVIQLSTEITPDSMRPGGRVHRRFVSEITEVVGLDPEGDGIYLKPLFSAPTGTSLRPTGFLPTFIEELVSEGNLNLDTLLTLDDREG